MNPAMTKASTNSASQDDVDTTAPSTLPAPAPENETAALSDADYDAIAHAVMETERGRWFLKEYARRNRNADTQTVLSALERLEDRLESTKPADDTSVELISHNVIDLAQAITDVKREVEELGAKGDSGDHFNSATTELDAIVSQTEAATGEILESAEKIQEVLWTLREGGADETQCDIIETKIIDIYTACSFQDLTGQRSSKVVRLVGYVEKRIQSMMEILGLARPNAETPPPSEQALDDQSTDDPLAAYQKDDARADAHLLHGPALEGDGNEQDDVDALFNQGQDGEDDLIASGEASAIERAQAAIAQASQTIEEADKDSDDINAVQREDVAELQEVEIIGAPEPSFNSEELADTNSTDDLPQDIFEVDSVAFEGLDMADRDRGAGDNSEDLGNSSDTGPSGLLIIRTPDDFDLDDGAADMFVDEADTPAEPESAQSIEVDLTEDYQEIFEVEDFDVSDDLAESEDDLDAAMLAEDRQEASNPNTVDSQQAPQTSKEVEEALPYTDEERIALFS